jgi:hypothetical protein
MGSKPRITLQIPDPNVKTRREAKDQAYGRPSSSPPCPLSSSAVAITKRTGAGSGRLRCSSLTSRALIVLIGKLRRRRRAAPP